MECEPQLIRRMHHAQLTFEYHPTNAQSSLSKGKGIITILFC